MLLLRVESDPKEEEKQASNFKLFKYANTYSAYTLTATGIFHVNVFTY